MLHMYPVAEFSATVCRTQNFFCSSDDGVSRLLITENNTSYKNTIYKNEMMWIFCQFKIEFIIINHLKVKDR